jgi:septal ring factor EnvC (AmiA/AmiB activator)
MYKKPLLIFLMLIFSCALSAQDTKEEIQKKQQDLQREITDLNNTLDAIKKNKKESLGQLALIQKKISTRQQLIRNLGRQMNNIDDNIYQNEITVNHYKLELDTLKLQYAKSIIFAYKNRSNYDYLNFLFSASSFNDAIKRITYLKSYRQYRETQVADINKTENLLQQQIGILNNNKIEKSNTIKEQGKQLQNFENDKKENDEVVQELKNKEKDVAEEIRNKEKTRQKLQQSLQAIIRREIAEAKEKERQEILARQQETERQKKLAQTSGENKSLNNPSAVSNTKQAAAPTGQNNKNERTYSPFESTQEGLTESINFENNRGRLPWPVSSGNVISPFGEHSIPGTNLHEDNPGIDISLPRDAVVKAVADGEVTSVFDLGGEQAVVIRHGKYFTTYSHLSSVNISKGDAVKSGTVLGHAAEGDDGQGLLTFMVSDEKGVNLNPENWLRAR